MNILNFNPKSLPIQHRLLNTELYEVIENEEVSGIVIKNITIAGALLSLSSFDNVTFENCTFFGSRIENCDFSGCKFSDCVFQFSECVNCNFDQTQFLDCTWHSSPIRNCTYSDCFMDQKTVFYKLRSEGIAYRNARKQLVA